MKKIVLISASILALGAASIAADADGVHLLNGATEPVLMSYAAPVSSANAESHTLDPLVAKPGIDRNVRLVSSGIESANSCDKAHWPYYPAECLQSIETSGL
ncbi:hypothetical protein SAMN05877838_3235 [Hoeflea halophila]|uniref:Uncharacterized protein n=1 Tax=Hoeflea halophila TaxID=714899 RepID=A0A286IG68_9HYPH|nr:hypothetical protein [Hoeflea halophila]SOE18314.1 hypothetical protein SAMN05877838_3235 [Hoeflea halophila]